jgi:hypothetical protein
MKNKTYGPSQGARKLQGLAEAAQQAAREECRDEIERDDDPAAENDCVLATMLKLGGPITQQRYLALAYWDNRTLEDLGPEERCELPEGFEEWPVDDLGRVN